MAVVWIILGYLTLNLSSTREDSTFLITIACVFYFFSGKVVPFPCALFASLLTLPNLEGELILLLLWFIIFLSYVTHKFCILFKPDQRWVVFFSRSLVKIVRNVKLLHHRDEFSWKYSLVILCSELNFQLSWPDYKKV